MPILPLLLLALLAISSTQAGLIGARVPRQADSAATAAAESAAANEGLSLLQIFQDQSMSRAGIKQRVSSWASDNQFADLVAAFEDSVRQRTLARREQAKEAAVELPKALDTIAEIEDDMLLTPSETYSKVDQTLNGFSPKLKALVLTAMEPTPLSNSTTEAVQRDDLQESSGDLPVEVVEEGSGMDVEGSGVDAEGSGEGSGAEVEGSGERLELRSLLLRSPVEGSGVEGSGVEGSGDVEGSGSPSPLLPLRDESTPTSTDGSLLTSQTTTSLPPIQVIIDVYDDTTSTPSPSATNQALFSFINGN